MPQQALALENSSLASEMATKIAARIEAFVSESTDAEFIRAAFLTVLSTEPTEPERLFVAQMLPQLIEGAREQKRPNPEVAARIAVILALLNHNDFVTIR